MLALNKPLFDIYRVIKRLSKTRTGKSMTTIIVTFTDHTREIIEVIKTNAGRLVEIAREIYGEEILTIETV
jgi:hypothetical protein